MKIFHISAECYPIAKVGGLADVVGALPKYQNKLGEEATVIMPYYNVPFTKENTFDAVYKNTLVLGNRNYEYQILQLKNKQLGFDLFLVDVPDLLYKDYVYSYDDSERFLAFQIATLNWMLTLEQLPDLVHCHDHHTGLTPFMMSQSYAYNTLKNIPTIVTIHNAQYQGWFSHDKVSLIPPFDFNNVGLLDWGGTINPLATAIKCAWRVTTVSPNYIEELKTNANGLEALLNYETGKCSGILNGIDTAVWNPETDTYIEKNYKITSIQSGKKASKKWLCDTFELNSNKPLFTFIGRLVGEKGADLLPSIFEKALQENDISILLLGSGNENVENELKNTAEKYKGKFSAYIGYNEQLSHYIYAGADFLLMPSRVEPCGLNQMYALRYGTIPVVNAVGGLKDTIIDINDNGFGFVHNQASVNSVTEAIRRATVFYENDKEFKKIRKHIMGIDHSWEASAQAYINLYNNAIMQ